MGQTTTDLVKSERQQVQAFLKQNYESIGKMLQKTPLTAEAFMRNAMMAVHNNPSLLTKCDKMSLFVSLLQSAAMGLEVNSPKKHAALVPYQGQVKLIPQYQGLQELARRSGLVAKITSHNVYANDKFEILYGVEEKLVHRPAKGERGEWIGTYACVFFRDGSYDFEFMERADVEKIRNNSPGKNADAWRNWPEQQQRKCAVRRLANMGRIPMDNHLALAIALDNNADTPEPQQKEINITQFTEEDVDLSIPGLDDQSIFEQPPAGQKTASRKAEPAAKKTATKQGRQFTVVQPEPEPQEPPAPQEPEGPTMPEPEPAPEDEAGDGSDNPDLDAVAEEEINTLLNEAVLKHGMKTVALKYCVLMDYIQDGQGIEDMDYDTKASMLGAINKDPAGLKEAMKGAVESA